MDIHEISPVGNFYVSAPSLGRTEPRSLNPFGSMISTIAQWLSGMIFDLHSDGVSAYQRVILLLQCTLKHNELNI